MYRKVSIMWMSQSLEMDREMATDACLTGVGGFSGGQYFHVEIPEHITSLAGNIIHYELMAVLVGLRKWSQKLTGKKLCIQCDNQAVVNVINYGQAKDRLLQSLLRLFAFICVTAELEVVAQFIPGADNRTPDLLSHFHLDDSFQRQFIAMKEPHWQEIAIELSDWDINEIW